MPNILDDLNELRVKKGFEPLKPFTNENDTNKLLTEFGIGVGQTANDTVIGGAGLLTGGLGKLFDSGGVSNEERDELRNAGFSDEEIDNYFPLEESWLSKKAQDILSVRNYIADSLNRASLENVGDNPTLLARTLRGAGTSAPFAAAGLLMSNLGGGALSRGLLGALTSGGLESLTEAGGFLGEQYRNGQYNNGAVGNAWKDAITNFVLNTGLDFSVGRFAPYIQALPNGGERFIYGGLAEIANELLQEPSQQVIEQAAQNAQAKGTPFMSELQQDFNTNWKNYFEQLAPEVAGSTALTHLVTGGIGSAGRLINRNQDLQLKQLQKNRQQALQELVRNSDPEEAGLLRAAFYSANRDIQNYNKNSNFKKLYDEYDNVLAQYQDPNNENNKDFLFAELSRLNNEINNAIGITEDMQNEPVKTNLTPFIFDVEDANKFSIENLQDSNNEGVNLLNLLDEVNNSSPRVQKINISDLSNRVKISKPLLRQRLLNYYNGSPEIVDVINNTPDSELSDVFNFISDEELASAETNRVKVRKLSDLSENERRILTPPLKDDIKTPLVNLMDNLYSELENTTDDEQANELYEAIGEINNVIENGDVDKAREIIGAIEASKGNFSEFNPYLRNNLLRKFTDNPTVTEAINNATNQDLVNFLPSPILNDNNNSVFGDNLLHSVNLDEYNKGIEQERQNLLMPQLMPPVIHKWNAENNGINNVPVQKHTPNLDVRARNIFDLDNNDFLATLRALQPNYQVQENNNAQNEQIEPQQVLQPQQQEQQQEQLQPETVQQTEQKDNQPVQRPVKNKPKSDINKVWDKVRKRVEKMRKRKPNADSYPLQPVQKLLDGLSYNEQGDIYNRLKAQYGFRLTSDKNAPYWNGKKSANRFVLKPVSELQYGNSQQHNYSEEELRELQVKPTINPYLSNSAEIDNTAETGLQEKLQTEAINEVNESDNLDINEEQTENNNEEYDEDLWSDFLTPQNNNQVSKNIEPLPDNITNALKGLQNDLNNEYIDRLAGRQEEEAPRKRKGESDESYYKRQEEWKNKNNISYTDIVNTMGLLDTVNEIDDVIKNGDIERANQILDEHGIKIQQEPNFLPVAQEDLYRWNKPLHSDVKVNKYTPQLIPSNVQNFTPNITPPNVVKHTPNMEAPKINKWNAKTDGVKPKIVKTSTEDEILDPINPTAKQKIGVWNRELARMTHIADTEFDNRYKELGKQERQLTEQIRALIAKEDKSKADALKDERNRIRYLLARMKTIQDIKNLHNGLDLSFRMRKKDSKSQNTFRIASEGTNLAVFYNKDGEQVKGAEYNPANNTLTLTEDIAADDKNDYSIHERIRDKIIEILGKKGEKLRNFEPTFETTKELSSVTQESKPLPPVSQNPIQKKQVKTVNKPAQNVQTEAVNNETEVKEKPVIKPVEQITEENKTDNQPVQQGKTAKIRTMRGTEVEVRYRVVNADDLIVSTKDTGSPNPLYPQELQPRERNRQYSKRQVMLMASTLDPELLAENRLASDGAPVIGSDMVVESGNGRVMAINEAYSYHNDSSKKYKKWIYDNAERFGVNPDEVAKIKRPVLVRERISDVDRVKFTSEANEASVSVMSSTENALNDAKVINDGLLSTYDYEKKFEANKDFIRNIIFKLPPSQRGDLITKDGAPSRSGIERVKNALAAKAYNDTTVLDRLSEVTDDDIQNVSNALMNAAPKIAIFENSKIRPELSIRDDIMKATSILADLKRKKQKVAEYLANFDLFDDSITPDTKKILKFFGDNQRKPRLIANGLMNYADIAINEAQENQSVIPGLEDSIRTKGSILDEAFRVAEEGYIIDNQGRIENETYSQADNDYTEAELKIKQDFVDNVMKAKIPSMSENLAHALSDIYLQSNKYFAKYTGIPLKSLVKRDNISFKYDKNLKDKADITFGEDLEALIRLSDTANNSSALHEVMGHFFLKKFQTLYQEGLLKGQAKQDFMTLLKSYGINENIDFDNMSEKDKTDWKNGHEKFATDVERYFRTGEAPNSRLKHVFDKFKEWLKKIYYHISSIKYVDANGEKRFYKLAPEIKQVFDNIFSVEDHSHIGELEVEHSGENHKINLFWARTPNRIKETLGESYVKIVDENNNAVAWYSPDKNKFGIRQSAKTIGWVRNIEEVVKNNFDRLLGDKEQDLWEGFDEDETQDVIDEQEKLRAEQNKVRDEQQNLSTEQNQEQTQEQDNENWKPFEEPLKEKQQWDSELTDINSLSNKKRLKKVNELNVQLEKIKQDIRNLKRDKSTDNKTIEALNKEKRKIQYFLDNIQNIKDNSPSVKPKVKVKPVDDLSFERAETERRISEAEKGVQPISLSERVKKVGTKVKNSLFKGAYPLLTSKEAEAKGLLKAKNHLLKLENDLAKGVINQMKQINKTLKPLNEYQRKLFTRKRMLDDLMWRKENKPDARLPFDFDEDYLRKEHERFTRMAEKDPAVMKAIELEEQENKRITSEFSNVAGQLGLNVAKVFNNPHYFRHIVLEYANTAFSRGKLNREYSTISDMVDDTLNGVLGRLYRYKGSDKDINANYAQVMAETRANMAADIEIMKTLAKLKQDFDKSAEVKGKLKQALKSDGQEKHSQGEGMNFDDIIPDGYVLFDPVASRLVQSASSPNENLVSMTLDDISEETGLPLNSIMEALSGEAEFYSQDGDNFINRLWVIPKELADTLKNMGQKRDRGMLGTTARVLTSWWKRSVLYSPFRNLKYNFRNLTGDLDAIIAGKPEAMRFARQAMTELWGYYRNNKTNPILQGFIDRSGGMRVESMNINQSEIENYRELIEEINNNPDRSIPRKAWDNVRRFFALERTATEFREQILRYAAYLSFMEDMKNNHGKPISFGASNEAEIMAIIDDTEDKAYIKDRAYRMSNDLLGNYQDISDFGKMMRQFAVPFWSWNEANTKRYFRMIKNGFSGKNSPDFAKKFWLAQGAKIPFYSFSAALTIGKISLFTTLIQLFNRALFPEDEDNLPESVKYRPHLMLGNWGGDIHYFDRIGALADLGDWFSLDSIVIDAKQIKDGQKTLGQYAKQIAKAPVSKALNSLNPLITMPFELATGRNLYPDAFASRSIRDSGKHLATTFGVTWPYKILKGEPRNDWNEALNLLLYSVDPDEAAYFQTLDKVRQFQELVLDKHFEGFSSTKRGRALANMKLAMRYKDGAAVRRYMREYLQLDGTKKGLEISMKSMNPLHGLTKKEQTQFLKWASDDDKKYLRKAQRYWRQLAGKYAR